MPSTASAIASTAAAGSMAGGDTAMQRCEWMHQGRWGFFLHFLAGEAGGGDGSVLSAEEWNRRVDAVDVPGLAAQAARLGAGWVGLTIGQNSGHYCAPNPVYDRLTGITPSRCSRRDLVGELAAALAAHGIRLMAYLPSGAPEGDAAARAALGWRKADACLDFQRRWEDIIACWSRRWGGAVAGWWFDGCYWSDLMYRRAQAPNFASFAAAVRAGNPAAAVAWNTGVTTAPARLDAEEDFTAGEVNEPELVEPPGRTVDGAQLHILTYLGRYWGQGPARFAPERAAAITRALTDCGGAVTWDVPFTPAGLVHESCLAALAAVGAAVNPTRGHPDRQPPAVPTVQLAVERLPEAGAPGLATLTVVNARAVRMAGAVALEVEPAGAAAVGGDALQVYDLAPGERRRVELPLHEGSGDGARRLVAVRRADGRRIACDLPRRLALTLPAVQAAGAAALPAALAGLAARRLITPEGRDLGDLRLARCGGRLAVWVRAWQEPAVRTRGLWDGSCLELFACTADGAIRQLLLAPPADGHQAAAALVRPAENQRDAVAPGAQLDLHAGAIPGGWQLAALIDPAWWLGAAPRGHLLCDAILGAGGRAGLSGALDAFRRSDAYPRLAWPG